MKAPKTTATLVISVLMAATHPAWSANPVRTTPGTIKVMEAGWAADTVSIETNAPVVNPAQCPTAYNGYVTRTDDPGRHLYHDILRAAWVAYAPVELLISGTPGDCPYGKPRIISVKVVALPIITLRSEVPR